MCTKVNYLNVQPVHERKAHTAGVGAKSKSVQQMHKELNYQMSLE